MHFCKLRRSYPFLIAQILDVSSWQNCKRQTHKHKKRLACLSYWLTDFRSCYECLPGQSRQSANSNPLHYHLAFHQWKVQTEAEPPSIMYRPTPPILLPHIIMTLMKQCKSDQVESRENILVTQTCINWRLFLKSSFTTMTFSWQSSTCPVKLHIL